MGLAKTLQETEAKVRALESELAKYRAKATAPGATATAPAATKPAPTSITPTWDKFQALPEREKQAFYEQHKAELAAEQRRVAAKGGAR